MPQKGKSPRKRKLSIGWKIIIFLLWAIFIVHILDGETIPGISLEDMPALIGLLILFLPLLLKPIVLLVSFIIGIIRRFTEIAPRIVDSVRKEAESSQPTEIVQGAFHPEYTTENLVAAIDSGYDELLPDAVDVAFELGEVSIPALQRKLKIGYSRAARIVDQMEELGVAGPYEGSKPRMLLITRDQWPKIKNNITEHRAASSEPENAILREIDELEAQFRSSYAFTQERMLNARECGLMFQKVKNEFLAGSHPLPVQLRFEQLCEEYEPKFAKPNSMLYVDAMSGVDFERWCANLLDANGFQNVETTKASNDQGVDLLAEKDGIKYAIQCKCYASDLGNTPIQEVTVGKAIYRCHVGVVMTNRHFTKGAIEAANATGTLLWDREHLKKMIDRAPRENPSLEASAATP